MVSLRPQLERQGVVLENGMRSLAEIAGPRWKVSWLMVSFKRFQVRIIPGGLKVHCFSSQNQYTYDWNFVPRKSFLRKWKDFWEFPVASRAEECLNDLTVTRTLVKIWVYSVMCFWVVHCLIVKWIFSSCIRDTAVMGKALTERFFSQSYAFSKNCFWKWSENRGIYYLRRTTNCGY